MFSKLSASVGAETHLGHVLGGFGGLSFLLVGTGYRHFRRGRGALDRSRPKIAIRDGTRDPQDYLGRGAVRARM